MTVAVIPEPFLSSPERHPLAQDVAEVVGHPLGGFAVGIGEHLVAQKSSPPVIGNRIERVREVPGHVREAGLVLDDERIVGAVVGIEDVESALEQLYRGIEGGFRAVGASLVEVVRPVLRRTHAGREREK